MTTLARRRLPLMALAGVSLLVALLGGLARLGWPLPLPPSGLAGHGPLMVTGFLGTLIGLERAVALKRLWAYGAPLAAGFGGLALLLGLSPHLGHALSLVSSVFLLSIFALLCRRHPSWALATMGVGALLWVVGNLLWHWQPIIYRVVPWWIGFLVLTIAGERLELSRILQYSRWVLGGFALANGLFVTGLVVSLFALDRGVKLGGIGLLLLALWLLRYDLARRTLRQRGLARYAAVCLLSGYCWLGVGGVLWLVSGDRFWSGPAYDAMLHTIVLGFVFSMIFGHAPIILPSVLAIVLPFQRAFYLHWGLLHLSLIVRIGGDIIPWIALQRWGGLGNALAILLFLIQSVSAALEGGVNHES